MKGFFSKLTKIHPSPSIPDQSRKNSDGNVPNSLQLSPSMIFSKKRTLQTQSFSPRPILKKKSVSGQKRPSLHSEDDENILINSESNNHETIPRRKTKKLSKIYPDSKRSSEETDFAMKKTLKKREKLAELKKFDEKFDQNKLAEKAKKFSLKRSNTMVYKEEKNKKNSSVSFQNSLQRPSEGNLPSPNRFKEENLDDNFFKDIHDENRLSPSYNNVDFSEEGVKVDNFKIHKKITLRKQRVNYRLRFDEKYKKIKFIIFPDDPFRTKWDLIVLGFLIYSAIILPVVTAFIEEEVLDPFWFFDIIMDGVFFTDVIINLLSAYVYEEILVTNHWRIFKSYLSSGWLLIDLTSSVPLDLILEANSQASNEFLRILKIPRLYKLLKMTRLVRILKIIKERNKILRYFNEMFKLNSGLERVLIAIIMILLFCHVVACLWYILSDIESDYDYETWLYMNDLKDRDIMDLYLASLYFTVQTVVTVGYGDLHSYSFSERLFASGLMLVGVFVYSFAIGSLTSLMSSFDQKNASYSKALSILAQIKNEYHLNPQLFIKIKNHLKFGQNYEKNHKKMIEELPVSLRTEIIIKINQDVINNIPFLKNKPTSFISFLCPLLKRVKINKNDYIFMKNDPAEEMFFIKSGKVAAVFPKYNNFRFLKINPGYYFGEMDILFYSNIRRYTYVAIKDSEFYIISRKNFKKIFLVEFRDIGMEFVQESYLRKKRTKRIYLEALAACKIAFNNKKKDNIGLNWNNLPKMNNFKAKESIYDNNDNMGFGLNAEKLLAKKSFELKQEKEVSFLRKENDYFFKEEVDVEKPSENNIENALVDEKDDNNENNNLDANKNDEFAIETEKPKTNKLNLKLLINNVLDSNQNENHLPNTHENIDNVNLLPTPIKKSLAAYTFQKVLASNRKNKRMGMGENLKKVAQKETLKEKIKFFTDRVNKMDLDINNLIAFSRQLQIKYQDKIESLKAKPLPVNPLVPLNRKMRKNPTLSHINFIKSDSLKKKHNKNPMIPSRRKSDTTTARSFLANLGANNANLVGSNNNNNSEKNENSSKKLNKIPKTLQKTQAILRLQKLKDDIVRDRRNSLDQRGPKLERRPSFILKRKESILEEGSLVSQEQQELKDSMLKIKGKVSNSKNILQNANRRGSEMLSYRGSKSPKSVIGKNIFQNQFNSVSPPLKKKAFVLDIKPMKRTSSFIRRKSDRFVEISTGFNKNESGFFIEKTNRSIRKLSRKIILNSETDFLNDKKVKSNRRFSENLKNNGFANTLRNLEPLVRNANANPTITSSSKSEEMSDSVSRSKSSVRFMKSLKAKSSKFSLKSSKRSSKKSLKGTEKSRKLFNEEDEKIHEFRKEYNGEEKELIDGIDEYLVEKKNEDMVERKKLKQIGNLKFMINLKDDRNSKK